MNDSQLGHTVYLSSRSFEEVIELTTAALKEQGFGIITEIDVKATMKAKLDVDFRNYRILGACNPHFAHRALTEDLFVGLLLPCNVAVFQADDGSIAVSVIKPEEMFKVMDQSGLADLAREVGQGLEKVTATLQAAASRS